MICAIVEHFLTDAGRVYFPKWIEHIRQLLEVNKNYLSLHHVAGINVKEKDYEPRRCIIELKFKSLSTLTDWVATDEHIEILRMLEPYVISERKTTIYEYPQS